jgi:hypothetical protein
MNAEPITVTLLAGDVNVDAPIKKATHVIMVAVEKDVFDITYKIFTHERQCRPDKALGRLTFPTATAEDRRVNIIIKK